MNMQRLSLFNMYFYNRRGRPKGRAFVRLFYAYPFDFNGKGLLHNDDEQRFNGASTHEGHLRQNH